MWFRQDAIIYYTACHFISLSEMSNYVPLNDNKKRTKEGRQIENENIYYDKATHPQLVQVLVHILQLLS